MTRYANKYTGRNDMTVSYVCHESFTRVTCLMRTYDTTYSYVYHSCTNAYISRVTGLIRTSDMQFSHVRHDSGPSSACA